MLAGKTHRPRGKFLLAGNEVSVTGRYPQQIGASSTSLPERRRATFVCKVTGARRLEAAMKNMLPSLMGVVLCTLALNSAAADPTAPLSTKPDEGWHADVTVIPQSHRR